MDRLLRLLFPAAFLAGMLSFATSTHAENNAATSIERMKKDIFFLASEACEGRGCETEGLNKAAEYLATELKNLGIKPAMKNGSYFQPFTLKGSTKLATPNNLVLKGPLGQEIVAKINTHFTVSGLSAKGKISAPVVFAGYGITVKDGYDDYRDLDVANKIVIVLRQAPRTKNDKSPFHPEVTRFAPLAAKINNAEAHKAVGLIFVNDRDSAGTTDDLMTFEYAQGGGAGSIPVIHIRRSLLDQMLAPYGKTISEIEEAIDRDLKPMSFALKGWNANIETSVDRVELQVKNVIGYIEGAGPLANETIVIGAHYDHLGRGERGSMSKGSKAIHFGADDNGSGTTAVLELARRFAGMKDRKGRRIVFMFFSAEERGLLGSQHYCNKDPLFPLKDTIAMLNLDMVGRLRPDEKSKKDKLEIGGVGSAKEFEKLIDEMNTTYNFDLKKTKSGTGPSDHTSFYQKGVPVYFFFTGFHPEYHRPTDKPDKINLEGMKKIVELVQELTLKIDQNPKRPEYVKGQTGSFPSVSAGGNIPRIGFMPGEYNDDESRGVPVGGVSKGSPAEKSGLKTGDWIIEVAGQPVKNMQGYMRAIAGQSKGKEFELTILRGKEKLKLKVTPE